MAKWVEAKRVEHRDAQCQDSQRKLKFTELKKATSEVSNDFRGAVLYSRILATINGDEQRRHQKTRA